MDTEPLSNEITDPATEEIFTSWAILILIALLIGSLWTSYYLQQKRIRAVHETVISIFSGMLVGLIIRILPGHFIQEHVSFSYSFFFNLLLPPIILNSGYEIHQENFFRNIMTILTFAFLGTFMAAVILGFILFAWTSLGIEAVNISLLDAISVGAALSATDPVTILSIFNAYQVDPKLYTIIFGESLLNDAICIVMFETAQKFSGESFTISSLIKAAGMFLMTFTLSLLIGTIVGIMTALLLKHSQVRRFPEIESCLVLLFAYASYFFSNGCHMSGIVSLLFCGITLQHYAYYNMSSRTQIAVKYIFQLLAQLSENFIFIYLGLSLFTEVTLVFKPLLIIVTTIGICISRWAAVFPLSKLINFIHRRRSWDPTEQNDEIPKKYQMMLFWAGLRGAVGVALAAGLTGEHANSLKATVLVVVVLTVIVFGGTTAHMLEILHIETGVVENTSTESSEFDIEAAMQARYTEPNSGTLKSTSESMSKRRPVMYQDDSADAESESPSIPSLHTSRARPKSLSIDFFSHVRSASGSTSQHKKHRSSSSLSGILTRSTEEHAKWFQDFDEHVLKPVLLDSSPNES